MQTTRRLDACSGRLFSQSTRRCRGSCFVMWASKPAVRSTCTPFASSGERHDRRRAPWGRACAPRSAQSLVRRGGFPGQVNSRLESHHRRGGILARTCGATTLINSTDGGAVQRLLDLTASRASMSRSKPWACRPRSTAVRRFWRREGASPCRRPRCRRSPASREAVGPQHHHHHAAGGHGHDADAAESGAVRPASASQAGHAPLPAARHPAGLRDVRTCRERRRAQGHPHQRPTMIDVAGADVGARWPRLD